MPQCPRDYDLFHVMACRVRVAEAIVAGRKARTACREAFTLAPTERPTGTGHDGLTEPGPGQWLGPLMCLARLLMSFAEGIIASAVHRLNTTVLDGMNKRIKVIKRMDYGCRGID